MRKAYNEFFDVPEMGKISEKVIMMRAVFTVAIMVVCLAAMSITAYAYFSYNVTSHFSIIRAANFETDVLVQLKEEDESFTDLMTITSTHKAHQVTSLEAGKTYKVTIKPTQNNTAENGFVILEAYNTPESSGSPSLASAVYHTQQLGIDVSAPNGKREVISFYLVLDADADVIFYSHWGTSSYYGYGNEECYVAQGDTISIAVSGAALEDELLATPTPIPELTPAPTIEPTEAPTGAPDATLGPTMEPDATAAPTEAPAVDPTEAPEVTPTMAPVEEVVSPEAPAETETSETTNEVSEPIQQNVTNESVV